jgi:hypothetical protein
MKTKTKAMVMAAVMLLAAGAGTAVFAQSAVNPWGQTVTVEGTLQLQNGQIVLVSGNTNYFVPMLTRYVGFVDGLKEGAHISVQGYAGGYNMLMPTAFTVNGKSYDVSTLALGGAGYCGGTGGRRGRTGCGWGRW